MVKFKCSGILLIFLVMALAFACFAQGGKKAHSLDDLDWLIGTWKRETRGGLLYEKWTKVSCRTFEGDSFSVSGEDTTFVEFLRLEQFGDEIFYVPKVAHNKYPVPFKLIDVDDNIFTFENCEHDFPQRIIYRRKTDGGMHVRIEGTQNEKEAGVDFEFVQAD